MDLAGSVVATFMTWLPEASTITTSHIGAGMQVVNIMCTRAGRAPLTVMVSASECILEAGRGTRFELDPLPSSLHELSALARAIVEGHLVEWVSDSRVDFQLAAGERDVRRGGQTQGLWARRPTTRVSYLPYC
ncbi:MAG: hypothetical protein QOI76_3653 [Frankiales bacterium]|jgi:hypothetical protein|nr:hypothetical protein [Frankiales bacterium]